MTITFGIPNKYKHDIQYYLPLIFKAFNSLKLLTFSFIDDCHNDSIQRIQEMSEIYTSKKKANIFTTYQNTNLAYIYHELLINRQRCLHTGKNRIILSTIDRKIKHILNYIFNYSIFHIKHIDDIY